MTELVTVVERVKKLLALADDQAGLPEGITALRKAQALMLQWNLEQSEILKAEGKSSDPFLMKKVSMVARTTPLQWRRVVYGICAEVNFCASIYITSSQDVRIVGQEVNTQITEAMAAYIVRQVVKIADATCDARHLPSFYLGAAQEIHSRLKGLLIAQQSAEANITALVVCKDAELQDAIALHLQGKTKTRLMTRRVITTAYEQGRETGRTVHLRPEIA